MLARDLDRRCRLVIHSQAEHGRRERHSVQRPARRMVQAEHGRARERTHRHRRFRRSVLSPSVRVSIDRADATCLALPGEIFFTVKIPFGYRPEGARYKGFCMCNMGPGILTEIK